MSGFPLGLIDFIFIQYFIYFVPPSPLIMASPLSSWFSATGTLECYIVGQSSHGRDIMAGCLGQRL